MPFEFRAVWRKSSKGVVVWMTRGIYNLGCDEKFMFVSAARGKIDKVWPELQVPCYAERFHEKSCSFGEAGSRVAVCKMRWLDSNTNSPLRWCPETSLIEARTKLIRTFDKFYLDGVVCS